MKRLVCSLIASVVLLATSVAYSQIIPTQGNIGQHLPVTIYASGNIFDPSAGPGGNILQLYLQKGNDYLIMFDSNWGFDYPNIIDPNTVETVVHMSPPYTQPGVYDLHIIVDEPNGTNHYTSPAAFTVSTPTGTITGNVYKDLNRNGIKDAGEPDLAFAGISIFPQGGNEFNVSADNSGTYSAPAYNGNYTVSFPSSSADLIYATTGTGVYNISINNNNSTGNNFGLNGALISITPAIVQKGVSSVHTITSAFPIFSTTPTAGGNVSQFTVLSNPTFNVAPRPALQSSTTSLFRSLSICLHLSRTDRMWIFV